MSVKLNNKIVNNEQKKTDDLLMKSTYHSYNLQCFRSWLWFLFSVEYCFFLCWFFLVWTAKLDNGLRAHTTNKRFVGQQQNYKYIYDHIKMVYEIIVRIQIWQDFVIIYKNVRLNKNFKNKINRKTLRMSIFLLLYNIGILSLYSFKKKNQIIHCIHCWVACLLSTCSYLKRFLHNLCTQFYPYNLKIYISPNILKD